VNWRQLSDHSTIMAPYNVLMYLFSAVPNRPILDEQSIPEPKVLRDNWQPIREEAHRRRTSLGGVPLFDETSLHYAENTTSDDRIILFCDVERPLRTRAMTAVNRWVSRNIVNESATQNEEGERVGWLNRVFGSVYQVRLVDKRMKAWDKRVYYAVKYLLIGGILAAFLATAFA
jgi:aspartyl/asparaginyl beta-hydroxylase (cupin superfamily)